jgi:hypothetical protein
MCATPLGTIAQGNNADFEAALDRLHLHARNYGRYKDDKKIKPKALPPIWGFFLCFALTLD